MRALFPSVLFLLGCASVSARVADQSELPSILVVENDRPDDSWVYLGHSGPATRKLGIARGMHTDTLLVPANEITPGAPIHFIAIAFRSAPAYTDQSEYATANHGVVYLWQLGPSRGQNSISARSAE